MEWNHVEPICGINQVNRCCLMLIWELLESPRFIVYPSLSTSFRIQGKQLNVDVLTPMVGKTTLKAVLIPALKIHAEPLRFLNSLLDDIQSAIIVAVQVLL